MQKKAIAAISCLKNKTGETRFLSRVSMPYSNSYIPLFDVDIENIGWLILLYEKN
jgi:hypothetical protein